MPPSRQRRSYSRRRPPVRLSANAVGTANRKATNRRSPPSQIDLSFKVFLLFEHSLGLNCLVVSPVKSPRLRTGLRPSGVSLSRPFQWLDKGSRPPKGQDGQLPAEDFRHGKLVAAERYGCQSAAAAKGGRRTGQANARPIFSTRRRRAEMPALLRARRAGLHLRLVGAGTRTRRRRGRRRRRRSDRRRSSRGRGQAHSSRRCCCRSGCRRSASSDPSAGSSSRAAHPAGCPAWYRRSHPGERRSGRSNRSHPCASR